MIKCNMKVISFILAVILVFSAVPSSFAAGDYLLAEDFDCDFGVMSGSGSTKITLEDGVTCAYMKGSGTLACLRSASEPGWNDSYSLIARVKSPNWSSVGLEISLNYSSVDKRYSIIHNGYGFYMHKWKQPYKSETIVKPIPGWDMAPNIYHTLRADIIRDKAKETVDICVYLNGKKAMSYTDVSDVYTNGGVVLGNTSSSGELFIDKIEVVPMISSVTEEITGGIPSPDMADNEYQKETTVLRDLGIMQNEQNGMWDGELIYKRGEFVDSVVKMLGYDEGSAPDSAEHPFTDISGNIYERSIAFAYEMGLIDNDTNSFFLPESPINGKDAQIILVKALGYKPLAINKGGNPNGYLILANQLKMSKHVKNTVGEITKNDAAMLIFNCLEIPLFDQVSWTNEGAVYGENGKTILSKHDIITGEGVLNASYVLNLNDNKLLQRDSVEIDNSPFFVGNTAASELLGCKVRYYAKETTAGDYTLLYIAMTDKNKVYKIFYDDIETDTNIKELVYTDADNKTRSFAIAPQADYIYNGELLYNVNANNLMPSYGFVKLIDRNSDNTADTVIINDFKTVRVLSAVESKKLVISKHAGDGTLDLSDDLSGVNTDIMRDGKIIDFEDIQKNDIICYYVSSNGKYKYAEVSSDKVTGIIEEYNKTEGTVMVKNKEYQYSIKFIAAQRSGDEIEVNLGTTYTFLLDSFGRIASVAENSYHSSSTYGWARKIGCDDGIHKTYCLEVFNQYGKWEILELCDKIKWNSSQKTDVSDFAKDPKIVDANNKLIPQLIEYITDDNGCISIIKTAIPRENAGDNSNMLCFDGEDSQIYSAASSSFGAKHFVNSSKVFVVPTANIYEDDFYSTTIKDIVSDGSKYDIMLYNEQYAVPAVYVVKQTKTYNDDPGKLKKIFVVTKGFVKRDEKTELPRRAATGLIDGKETTIVFSDNCIISDLAKGDVIQYLTNQAGEVVMAARRFKFNDVNFAVDGGFKAYAKMITGKVVYYDSNKKLCAISLDKNSDELTKSCLWIKTPSDARYYLYDTDAKVIGMATSHDIEVGSLIYTRISDETTTEVYVIR